MHRQKPQLKLEAYQARRHLSVCDVTEYTNTRRTEIVNILVEITNPPSLSFYIQHFSVQQREYERIFTKLRLKIGKLENRNIKLQKFSETFFFEIG